MSNPKIPGITWLDSDIPELIAIPITLEDRLFQNLGLDNLQAPTITVTQYIDLSKLSGLRSWYGKSSDEPSKRECLVDIEGMIDFVADVPLTSMLEAWMYYKKWKNSNK